MYSGDEAIRVFSELYNIPLPQVRQTRDEFYTRDSLDIKRVSGLEQSMADAVAYKFIGKIFTPAELDDLFKYRVK
jgi:hypothetical protein